MIQFSIISNKKCSLKKTRWDLERMLGFVIQQSKNVRFNPTNARTISRWGWIQRILLIENRWGGVSNFSQDCTLRFFSPCPKAPFQTPLTSEIAKKVFSIHPEVLSSMNLRTQPQNPFCVLRNKIRRCREDPRLGYTRSRWRDMPAY